MGFEDLLDELLKVLRHRVRSGELTERGLARRIGLSQPHVHNVLCGARVMSVAAADRVLSALDMTVADLMAREAGGAGRGGGPGWARSGPGGLLVGAEDVAGRAFPTESRHLLSAFLDQDRPEVLVEERVLQSTRYVEHVVGIDDDGGVPDDLGKGAHIGGDHRCAGRHGFEGGKTEAFIERRKGEDGGLFVEDAERVDRNEAKEPHGFLDAALHDREPDRGVARDVVADDDEPQISVF